MTALPPLDQHVRALVTANPTMTIPFYLMASYAYYEEDDPLMTDATFDVVARTALAHWDSIEHVHKGLLSTDMLEAGTFLLNGNTWPNVVKGAVMDLRRKVKGPLKVSRKRKAKQKEFAL